MGGISGDIIPISIPQKWYCVPLFIAVIPAEAGIQSFLLSPYVISKKYSD
jgi:hypothetical protein